jgi:hypothetical protein
MNDFTFTMGPSGQFVSLQGYQQGIQEVDPQPIWNPGVYDHLRNNYKLEAYEAATESLAGLLKSEYRTVQQADFDRYGEVLINLTNEVVAQNAHLNIGLLRGAYRPCVIVEVMTRSGIAYEFVDYTQHSGREAEIMPILRGILKEHDPQQQEFRLQITDTAIGGHGAEHFAMMLIGIKESDASFKAQQWTVFFNLLHDSRQGTNTGKMRSIENLPTKRIAFAVRLYEVPDLITEDYDGGLGLKFDGKTLKPCNEPGQFVLQSDSGISLIDSSDLRLTFDSMFTQAITDGLLTSPEYKQVGDIWNRQHDK